MNVDPSKHETGRCPDCDSGMGDSGRAEYGPGAMTISYVCGEPDCRRAWKEHFSLERVSLGVKSQLMDLSFHG